MRSGGSALSLTMTRGDERRPTLLGLLLIGRTDSLRRLVPMHEVLFQVLDGTRVKVNEGSRAALIEIVDWLDLLARRQHRTGIQHEACFASVSPGSKWTPCASH